MASVPLLSGPFQGQPITSVLWFSSLPPRRGSTEPQGLWGAEEGDPRCTGCGCGSQEYVETISQVAPSCQEVLKKEPARRYRALDSSQLRHALHTLVTLIPGGGGSGLDLTAKWREDQIQEGEAPPAKAGTGSQRTAGRGWQRLRLSEAEAEFCGILQHAVEDL